MIVKAIKVFIRWHLKARYAFIHRLMLFLVRSLIHRYSILILDKCLLL